MQELAGWIERITYHNEENHYTVAQLANRENSNLIPIVGVLPTIQVGESIVCKGNWKNHPSHGMQFEVHTYRLEMPTDIVAVEKFLSSGVIRGIGSTFASRIIKKFGAQSLKVIDESPHQLLNIDGFGEKKLEKLIQSWQAHKTVREILLVFQMYGVSRAWAQRIFRSWGQSSIQKLKEDPFQLARDIRGIGFKIADNIARHIGFEESSSSRIQAGILHTLDELSQEGNTCFPVNELIIRCQALLNVDSALIKQQVDELKQKGDIECSFLSLYSQTPEPCAWLKALYLAELGIAKEIERLKCGVCPLRQFDISKAVAWAQEIFRIKLAEHQIQALITALTSKVSIITGGPGTGKSTLTKAILAISEKLTSKIILAAPTGRAAKRMSEITHKTALTIHRLLKFDPQTGGFKYNREHPLSCDLLILDEASMIDTYLMYHLLKAIPSHCRVVIIGDVNQLPSIGPGQVLHDLITSHSIPVIELKHIFRQAAGSKIIINAHRINEGHLPSFKNNPRGDFFFLEANTPEEIRSTILELTSKRLPHKYGYHPQKDIQVLCPMKKGVIGLQQLNIDLQNLLNSQGAMHSGCFFREHDKVMQIKNNYSKEVFNGDIGYIKHVDAQNQTIIVNMEDREVEYEFSELNELTLAYAVSVHKFQGSECPCVVIPVHTSHFKLLTRNLLYTGVTRGRKLVVLVGTKKAVAIAVKSKDKEIRYTGLKKRLQATSNTF